MVEPASQSFQAQQDYLDKLEEQMAALGISTLFEQKAAAETAESKRLSRTDSDSMLTIISKDLQSALQDAFEMAATFVGKEAPLVELDVDFDLGSLDAPQIQQYLQLFSNNVITHETLLGMLKKGSVLPEVDIQEEVELVQQNALDNMMMEMIPGQGGPTTDAEGNEKRDPEVQQQATDRMRRLSKERDENDEDE